MTNLRQFCQLFGTETEKAANTDATEAHLVVEELREQIDRYIQSTLLRLQYVGIEFARQGAI